MPIDDFSPESVAAALAKLEGEAKTLAKKRGRLAERLAALAKQGRKLDEADSSLKWDIERLQTAVVLLQEIPSGVRELRRQLHEARENAARDDVTVREAAGFSADVGRLAKELIAACPHPFILQKQGYHDTYSADRDESYPGERACAICDHHEYEYARWGGAGGYTALVEAGHRLFARSGKGELQERAIFRQTKDLRGIVAAFTDERILTLLKRMTASPTE